MKRIIYRKYAIKRMVQGRISKKDILYVIKNGEMIENYPDDFPFSSKLILGWQNKRPLHIVVGEDSENDILYIVTAYKPYPGKWEAGFKVRKE